VAQIWSASASGGVLRAKRNGLAGDVYAVDLIDFFGVQPGIPILHIFSVEKAKEFYFDFLGLGIDPASTVFD
jgi:hypothetical protein